MATVVKLHAGWFEQDLAKASDRVSEWAKKREQQQYSASKASSPASTEAEASKKITTG